MTNQELLGKLQENMKMTSYIPKNFELLKMANF